MKNRILSAIVLLTITVMTLTACADKIPESVQTKVEEKKEEVTSKVTEEIKQATIAQLKDFLQSDELQNNLGFSEEQLAEVEQSLEQYIENYELDTDSLTRVAGEIKDLFDKAQELSQEDLQSKLDEILQK